MKIIQRLLIIIIVVVLVSFGAYKFSKVNLLSEETTFKVDIDKYNRAEFKNSTVPSRRWMNYGMEIAKKVNFAPASAARFYSYIASVYADVLVVSNPEEASLATGEIINILVPDYILDTNAFVATFNSPKALSGASQNILDVYKKRLIEDHYDLVWDKTTPSDKTKWFIRGEKVDKGAMAGKWSTWLLSDTDTFNVPTPPILGTLVDKLELQKVKYAVANRVLDDDHTIYFWHGSTGFEKGSNPDNITPSGVWQNILFTEVVFDHSKQVKDTDYAYSQKILAQSIADAFIKCWQVKYKYWTQRPSMRINNLDILVADPPFPSFVSEHATISATAATVLSALYPEKKQIWMDNLHDARNSRIMAGIHFDVDNKMGEYLGKQIGETIVQSILIPGKPVKKESENLKPKDNFVKDFIMLQLLRLQPIVKNIVREVTAFYRYYFDRPLFQNVIKQSGIVPNTPIAGASFIDYNNDDKLDIFIAGSGKKTRLYKGDGAGHFIDVTKQAGLENIKKELLFSGIFADYDNDGCLDLFMTGDPDHSTRIPNTRLYHSNCNGTFTDVTQKSGIYDAFHGRGSAWADYNNDGYLDLYVANQGESNSTSTSTGAYTYEPNMLYRNNKDGTFTDVTTSSGADGFIGTLCGENNYRIKVIGRGFKASLQPVWFDYNGDNLQDLFIATDSGISPLYRNNGDGTFTNVTAEAGLCKRGTGMGVTIGDYNNDGNLDIYITNVGGNYLWENQGNGTFKEKSRIAGVDNRSSLGWGTGFFDYDNDGYVDLYSVNGDVISGNSTPEIGKVRIDKLYHNMRNGTFSSVGEVEGITGNDSKEGAAFGDFDNNGFEDLLVLTGRKENIGKFRLYRNVGNSNHWLTLKLVGTKSNKDAVGAKVSLVSGELKQIREVISGSSYLSQNSLWPTFGLGKNKKVDSIKITWPSGEVQTLSDVKVDQKITVIEK